MLSSDSVDGLLAWTVNFVVLDWRRTKNLFYLRLVVLINTLCSESKFTRVNLQRWGGDWDRCCGDGVSIGTGVMGTGWGWVLCSRGRTGMGSVSVPMQTSKVKHTLPTNKLMPLQCPQRVLNSALQSSPGWLSIVCPQSKSCTDVNTEKSDGANEGYMDGDLAVQRPIPGWGYRQCVCWCGITTFHVVFPSQYRSIVRLESIWHLKSTSLNKIMRSWTQHPGQLSLPSLRGR